MNKKVALAVSGLAAITVVGGSFAYYSASQTLSNPFTTTTYASSTVEKFNPKDGDKWEPGAEINKDVYATNTGESDLWVRVKFDEVWAREDDQFITNDSKNANFFPTSLDDDLQLNATDGKTATDDLTTADGSVVYKKFANNSSWELNEDGYYYYKATLKPGDTTDQLLDSVTLYKNTDMGARIQDTYFATVKKDDPAPEYDLTKSNWTLLVLGEDQTTKDIFTDPSLDYYTWSRDLLDDNAKGYAKADYTLNITTEFVQAVEAAAEGWATHPDEVAVVNN